MIIIKKVDYCKLFCYNSNWIEPINLIGVYMQKNLDFNNIFERALNRDEEALNIMYEQYYSKVMYVCYKLCDNKEDAQEAIQDTFYKAFNSIHQLNDISKFGAWIKVLATRECYRKYRNKKVSTEPLDDITANQIQELDESFIPEKYVKRKELCEQLTRVINELPEKQRNVINLYYYSGIDTEEIAKLNDCSAGSVRKLLYDARNSIKEKIKKNKNYVFMPSTTLVPLYLILQIEEEALFARLGIVAPAFLKLGSLKGNGAQTASATTSTATTATTTTATTVSTVAAKTAVGIAIGVASVAVVSAGIYVVSVFQRNSAENAINLEITAIEVVAEESSVRDDNNILKSEVKDETPVFKAESSEDGLDFLENTYSENTINNNNEDISTSTAQVFDVNQESYNQTTEEPNIENTQPAVEAFIEESEPSVLEELKESEEEKLLEEEPKEITNEKPKVELEEEKEENETKPEIPQKINTIADMIGTAHATIIENNGSRNEVENVISHHNFLKLKQARRTQGTEYFLHGLQMQDKILLVALRTNEVNNSWLMKYDFFNETNPIISTDELIIWLDN